MAHFETAALPEPDLERFIRHNGNAYLRLNTPLLARANVPRSSRETIRVLCASEEMGCSRIKLRLPCRLGLKPGKPLDLELFVPHKAEPIAVCGIISSIAHTHGADLARYELDIRFCALNAETLHDIAEFVYSSRDNLNQLV